MSTPQYDQFEESPKIATAAFADCGKLLGAVPPDVLYHYTTPAGLLGIISSGEIFLSDAAFLNDSSEVIYARHLVSTVLAEHASAETDPARAAHLTYAAYDIQLEGGASAQFRYYVASFCEAPDLLSQWRAYGVPGSGYALGFHSSGLVSAGARFDELKKVKLRRVVYDELEQRHVIGRVVARWSATLPDDVSNGAAEYSGALLLAIAYILPQLKHPMFREEREWRLVVRMLGGADVAQISFRQTGQTLGSYIRMDLRVPDGDRQGRLPLAEIAHAPASESAFRKDAIRELLRSRGYMSHEVIVSGSSIPLRS